MQLHKKQENRKVLDLNSIQMGLKNKEKSLYNFYKVDDNYFL